MDIPTNDLILVAIMLCDKKCMMLCGVDQSRNSDSALPSADLYLCGLILCLKPNTASARECASE